MEIVLGFLALALVGIAIAAYQRRRPSAPDELPPALPRTKKKKKQPAAPVSPPGGSEVSGLSPDIQTLSPSAQKLAVALKAAVSGTGPTSIVLERGRSALAADDMDVEAPRKPLIVMYELEGWLIDGTNMASFVLYEDGLTLFGRSGVESRDLSAVRLAPAEVAALLAELSIGDDLLALPREHWAASRIDQVTTAFAIRRGEDVHLFEVYGGLRSDPAVRAAAPPPIVALFDALVAFTHPDGERWYPSKIEVSLVPSFDDGEGSVPWPEHWPTPSDPNPPGEGPFRCAIGGADLMELEDIYDEELPIEIEGSFWDVNYRLPIPNEPAARLNRALPPTPKRA